MWWGLQSSCGDVEWFLELQWRGEAVVEKGWGLWSCGKLVVEFVELRWGSGGVCGAVVEKWWGSWSCGGVVVG